MPGPARSATRVKQALGLYPTTARPTTGASGQHARRAGPPIHGFCLECGIDQAPDDTFGSIVHVRVFQVGIAYFTGDHDGIVAAIERVHTALDGREPLPNQLPYVLRAEGWAARARSDAEAAERLLRDAGALTETPAFAAQLAYEALRAGAQVAPRLAPFARRCESRLVSAYAAHAEARAARDGAALLVAAEEMAAIGALPYAMEAAVEAASVFLGQGRRDAEIADRLVLSTRTVESHIYRAMQKLGIHDRRDL